MHRMVLFALVAIAASPVALAEHGLVITGAGVWPAFDPVVAAGELPAPPPQSAFAYVGRYLTGLNDAQTWQFTFSPDPGAQFSCEALGSVEAGFRPTANCVGHTFSIAGTSHFHHFLVVGADAHAVAISLDGRAATAQQVTGA